MNKQTLTKMAMFLCLVSPVAYAGLKLEKKIEDIFIVVETGRQVSPVEATQAAIAGQQILKCTAVELVGKPTGGTAFKKKK